VIFKQLFAEPRKHYVTMERLRQARQRLACCEENIAAIAAETGSPTRATIPRPLNAGVGERPARCAGPRGEWEDPPVGVNTPISVESETDLADFERPPGYELIAAIFRQNQRWNLKRAAECQVSRPSRGLGAIGSAPMATASNPLK